jgi:tetratricopeptide (TPR) repeat protein
VTDYRYKAFVSYSWADAAWGKWLLQALETYRTPKALIGKDGAHGPVPARLIPLFKDREEEAAGASIGKAVETALSTSEFLIVICSPRSAASKWVNHEVAWFKTHRDPDRILALIVDGAPGSGGETECFPKALTNRVLADLTITDEPEDAPLAADARDSGDGKRKARLKLAAALLGVGLDELVGRDDRRRALRQRWVTAGSLLFGGSMAGLAWTAVQARNEADLQRAESDGLVEFMLTDLREKLEPVGRLDALDVVGQRALKYYAGQKPGSLDADALGRRSRALHLVGEVRNIRGDSAAGLAAFRQAAATTQELLVRDPDNAQRIFDHGQSVFWVGYIAYGRGESKEAEAQFREYKRLADRLVEIDPKNPDWQMETSYAESNLGTLLFEQGRYAEAERAFSRALGVVEAASRGQPDDLAKQVDYAQAVEWLGVTLEQQERIPEALAQYRNEIAIFGEILRKDKLNTRAMSSTATVWAGIGRLETMRGNRIDAIQAFAAAVKINESLRGIEQTNGLWRQYEINNRYSYGLALAQFGMLAEAGRQLAVAQRLQADLASNDPRNAIWTIDQPAQLEALAARLALVSGDERKALQRARDAIALLAKRREQNDPRFLVVEASAQLVAGDCLARLGDRQGAIAAWQAAKLQRTGQSVAKLATIMTLRLAALNRLGERAQASQLAAELGVRDWQHPEFRRDWPVSLAFSRERSSGRR